MADEVEDQVGISAEAVAAITNAVTSTLTQTINDRFEQMEQNNKPVNDAKPDDKPADDAKPDAITPESVAQAVLGMVQKTQVEDANKVFGVLYKEKLKSFTDSLNGFGDFLDSEDDYGDKRGDKLMEIEDYESRLGKLEKMAGNYSKALDNNKGQSPTTSVKAQKQAEDNQTAFDKAKQKFHDGGSSADYEDEFFSALSSELESLMG